MKIDRKNFKQELGNICLKISHSPVYSIDNYDYFVWPFKGIIPIDYQDLEDIAFILEKIIGLDARTDISKIFTFMTDGEIIAIPLARRLKKKIIIARDFHYNIPDVIRFKQNTRYYSREMFFSGINKSDRVVIVDAIIATGNSALSVINKFEGIGCKLSGVYTVVDKAQYGGSSKLLRKGITVRSLFTVKIKRGKVECIPNQTENLI